VPYDRITVDPNLMDGEPCIRGMRITVAIVTGMVDEGMSTNEILSQFPYLEDEDIRQALAYRDEHTQ